MSVTLFFSLRLSGRPFERIAHKLNKDAFSTCTVDDLKKIVVGELLKNDSNHAAVEFVYCGSVLDDSAELKEEGIKPGCTIHVFEKDKEPEPELILFTEESLSKAITAYRKIVSVCNVHRFSKLISTEVLNKILEKYPEFYNDAGAFAILNDILLIKMVRTPCVRAMFEQHPILIKAAEFFADTIINQLKLYSVQSSIVDVSDVEMSEDNSSQAYVEDQRVSRDQLAAALLSASNSVHSVPTSSSNTSQQYEAELQIMQEMGLLEQNINLQALILCNGNVEAAVNLILGNRNFV